MKTSQTVKNVMPSAALRKLSAKYLKYNREETAKGTESAKGAAAQKSIDAVDLGIESTSNSESTNDQYETITDY